MISKRRLAIGLAVAAAALLAGRAGALLFSDNAWYTALGAGAIWAERARNLTVLHLISAVFAGLFALVNLSAIRRSIVSLAFPRRLGTWNSGGVPRRILDRAGYFLAAAVALLMSIVVPPWEDLTRVRLLTRLVRLIRLSDGPRLLRWPGFLWKSPLTSGASRCSFSCQQS